MHEPLDLWERYVEPKYRDRVPKVAFMDGNRMVYEPGDGLRDILDPKLRGPKARK